MSKPKTSGRKASARKNTSKPQPTRPNFLLIGLGLVVLVALISAAALWMNRPAPVGAISAPAASGSTGQLPDEVSVAQAAALREQGAFILDVRTPEEWAEYHIPGSTLIPVDELESRIAEVPQGQQVVVVCRSGNRSAVGRDILKDASFDQVTSMAGGLKAWSADGLETVEGP